MLQPAAKISGNSKADVDCNHVDTLLLTAEN
jgi:hypothetical protein